MVVFETRLLPNSLMSRSLPEPIMIIMMMMIIIDGVGDGDDDDDMKMVVVVVIMNKYLGNFQKGEWSRGSSRYFKLRVNELDTYHKCFDPRKVRLQFIDFVLEWWDIRRWKRNIAWLNRSLRTT